MSSTHPVYSQKQPGCGRRDKERSALRVPGAEVLRDREGRGRGAGQSTPHAILRLREALLRSHAPGVVC